MDDDKIEKTRKLAATIFGKSFAKIAKKNESNPGQGNSELSAYAQAKNADVMQLFQKGNSVKADNQSSNQADEAVEVKENIIYSAEDVRENKIKQKEEHDECIKIGRIPSKLSIPPAVNIQPEKTAKEVISAAVPRKSPNNVIVAVDRGREQPEKEEEIVISDAFGIIDETRARDVVEAIGKTPQNSNLWSVDESEDEWTTYLSLAIIGRPLLNLGTSRRRPVVVLDDREKAVLLGRSSFKFPDKPVEMVFDSESADIAQVKGYVATNFTAEMDEALKTAL